MLGVTRPFVSRTLTSLQSQGVIRHERGVLEWLTAPGAVYAASELACAPVLCDMRPDFRANEILARAQPADREPLERALEPVRLQRGEALSTTFDMQEHVYFPVSCLIAVLVQLSDGRSAQVGLIGSEGFVGLPVLLETEPWPHRFVCQIGGDALQMSASNFRSLVREGDSVRRLLLNYAGVRLTEEVQNLACMSTHPVGPRLARWLLVMNDRVGSDHLPLTQEFLAEILAVRRPYLTGLMQELQRDGHIQYQRGRVSIVNRTGLASAACEDYHALRSMYARLFRSDST